MIETNTPLQDKHNSTHEDVRQHHVDSFLALIANMPPPKEGAPELTEAQINQLVHELR